MDEMELALRLEAHEHEIGYIKHQIRDLEIENRAIQELTVSVNRMAVSIENILKELNRQGERLEVLEKVPVENGKVVKAAVITSMVGGIVGAMVTAILAVM